jgi:micrococcal nuclease
MIVKVRKAGRPRLFYVLLAWTSAAMVQPVLGQVPADCGPEAGPARAVARIIDAETVRLDDGSEVRLIGALAPRASDVGAQRGVWPPEQAAILALTSLAQGRTVTLFGGRETDRYGRILAHAMVETAGKPEWLQGALLEQGMARAYGSSVEAGCLQALIARERPARDALRGLWSNPAYRVRNAEMPDDLVPLRHTFQVVSGTVTATSQARGQIILSFGERRRSGFSVTFRRTDQPLPGGARPKDLNGRAVLVRGWIDLRAGPIIDIDAGGHIEQIGAPLLPSRQAPHTRPK